MNKDWSTVRLGDVLTPIERSEVVDATKEYRLLGVRLDGHGPFLREKIFGSQSAATKLFRVATGDFIYSRLFAWRGAFGIIESELDGCYVSGEFPTFLPKADKIDARFLRYWFRLPTILARVDEDCTGSTPLTRNRFKEQFFLALEIPLPPLVLQRQLVARIEDLATQVHKARVLRDEAAQDAEQLVTGEERRIWPDAALLGAPHLESLTKFLARGKQSEQGESEHFLIKTQHVQQGRYIPTMMRLAPHTAAKVRTEAVVRDGDILVACSAAGCLGRVARYRADGKTVSTDTHVAIARANPELVDIDYLYAYLRGAQGQHQLKSRERGDWKREKISFRLTELNLNDLRKVPVPLPPLPDQRRIVAELDALQAEVDELKRLQTETAAELNGMLPAVLNLAFRGQLYAG